MLLEIKNPPTTDLKDVSLFFQGGEKEKEKEEKES